MSYHKRILKQLIAMSRSLGDPSRNLVILGEGNTSAKIDEETFFVKASGKELRFSDENSFAKVSLPRVLEGLDRETLTDEEVVVYDRIYGILSERLSKPDLVIYLQISLPTLLKRLAREGNAMEKNISERYLEDLIEAFDYFFFNYQVSPLLVIRADSLDLTRDDDLEVIIQQVRQMKTRQQFFVPAGHASKEFKKNK
jgi:cytidylate kinase